MVKADITDMPNILEILEINGELEHLEAIRNRCKYVFLSDSGDSMVTCYEGQPSVYHVHINAKPRRALEAIRLLEDVIASLFKSEDAVLVLGLTPANKKGWRRFIKSKEKDNIRYVDISPDLRMFYFTIEDYEERYGN